MQPLTAYSYERFTLKDTLNISFFTAIMITVGIVFGYVLGQAFGPGMAISNGFLVPIIVVMGVRAVWKFPCATIMLLIYAIIMIPFPIWGAPGIHKPLQGLLAGIIFDIIVLIFSKRNTNWSIVSATAIMDSAGVFMMYLSLLLYPEFEAGTFRQIAPFLIPIGLPLGALAGYIGNQVVKKAHN